MLCALQFPIFISSFFLLLHLFCGQYSNIFPPTTSSSSSPSHNNIPTIHTRKKNTCKHKIHTLHVNGSPVRTLSTVAIRFTVGRNIAQLFFLYHTRVVFFILFLFSFTKILHKKMLVIMLRSCLNSMILLFFFYRKKKK